MILLSSCMLLYMMVAGVSRTWGVQAVVGEVAGGGWVRRQVVVG